MNLIIGSGGVGSWLVPKLVRVSPEVIVMDGDKLEQKNLDRQLYGSESIGKNKAEATVANHWMRGFDGSMSFIPEYFHSGHDIVNELGASDLIWCCADNAAARREVLTVCDQRSCRAIIGANEYTDAEAYWYEPSMRGTPNDPRVFYPSILEDQTGDPLSPEGCTGAASVESPQLILANDWASGLMLHLFWFHSKVRPELPRDQEIIDAQPVLMKINKFRSTTIRRGDRK